MLLPILSFFIFLCPLCNSEIECVQCDARVTTPDKTCSNCTGDYCYVVNYKNRGQSLESEHSYFQGCFTSPTEMKLGCSQNRHGSILCVCNGSDYCNELANVKDATNLTYLTCQTKDAAIWPVDNDCVQPWCLKEGSSWRDEFSYCNDERIVLESFDIGFGAYDMFLPIDSCYSISADSRDEKKQYCVYRTNKTTPFKQKTPGTTKCYAPGDIETRAQNSSCTAQYCFSTTSSVYGCITQFNREGFVLKVGLYYITPFITPFYICDSNFCNNETIADNVEGRYNYPTKYIWNSARWNLHSLLVSFSIVCIGMLIHPQLTSVS